MNRGRKRFFLHCFRNYAKGSDPCKPVVWCLQLIWCQLKSAGFLQEKNFFMSRKQLPSQRHFPQDWWETYLCVCVCAWLTVCCFPEMKLCGFTSNNQQSGFPSATFTNTCKHTDKIHTCSHRAQLIGGNLFKSPDCHTDQEGGDRVVPRVRGLDSAQTSPSKSKSGQNLWRRRHPARERFMKYCQQVTWKDRKPTMNVSH